VPFQFFDSATDGSPIFSRFQRWVSSLQYALPPEVSGDALTVLETSNAPGFGPPLHRHGETEVFRVLEGRYLFEVNGQRFEAAAGDLVSVPGGDAHAFINITDKPARQLVMMLPGMDAQRFFFELGQVLEKEHPDRNALHAFGEP
jgi:quercetin dioxygenase-like cupin family protein